MLFYTATAKVKHTKQKTTIKKHKINISKIKGVTGPDERHVYDEGSNPPDFTTDSRFTGGTESRAMGFDDNDADETQEDVDHNGLHEYDEHSGDRGDATPSVHENQDANGNGDSNKGHESDDDESDSDESSESDDDDFNVIIDIKKPSLGPPSPPRAPTGKIATTAPNAGEFIQRFNFF